MEDFFVPSLWCLEDTDFMDQEVPIAISSTVDQVKDVETNEIQSVSIQFYIYNYL